MLNEILRHINNFFLTDNVVEDKFEITGGTINNLPFLNGQYVRIEGSILNDGVYLFPLAHLQDETFEGTITGLRIPKTFITLIEEIDDWIIKNPNSGFVSESMQGNSYTRATSSNGGVVTWQGTFASRLNNYRKI